MIDELVEYNKSVEEIAKVLSIARREHYKTGKLYKHTSDRITTALADYKTSRKNLDEACVKEKIYGDCLQGGE